MIRTYIKPIPTLVNPLNSIDFTTKKGAQKQSIKDRIYVLSQQPV